MAIGRFVDPAPNSRAVLRRRFFCVSNPRGIFRVSLWVERLPAMWRAFLPIEILYWIVVLGMQTLRAINSQRLKGDLATDGAISEPAATKRALTTAPFGSRAPGRYGTWKPRAEARPGGALVSLCRNAENRTPISNSGYSFSMRLFVVKRTAKYSRRTRK